MSLNIANELAALQRLPVKQLQVRYADVFGEATAVSNKTWLVKRIAWRLQALAEGDLSQRARQRAALLANDADVRILPPRMPVPPAAVHAQSPDSVAANSATPLTSVVVRNLPLPGSVITRIYKGQTLHVMVLPHGFEFAGNVYQSLSAVAKAITGQHCNGIAFFRLRKETAR